MKTEINEIIFQGDKYEMNWLRDDYTYGKVFLPEDLSVESTHEWQDGILTSTFIIKNVSEKPYFTSLNSIGIQLPLQDKYGSSEICISRRCHVHLYCGEDVSYVYALRMGGEAPHLGLIVTEGKFGNYSIERKQGKLGDEKGYLVLHASSLEGHHSLAKLSNDRGCFILHPSPIELQPGEETVIAWKIFAHEGEEDFYKKAGELTRFVKVAADKYVLFPGEECEICITPSFEAKEVTVNEEIAERVSENTYSYKFYYNEAEKMGDREFEILVDDVLTKCRVLLHEAPDKLAKKRCEFIMEKQQYHSKDGKKTGLDGAYLVYDNEEKHIVYSRGYDYNGGRERIGMGLSMAAYLRKLKSEGNWDERLAGSLNKYCEYAFRELIEEETGSVYNDFGYDATMYRLYNTPWYITFCVELYELYRDEKYLTCAYKMIRKFYQDGGVLHYSNELPILDMVKALEAAGMENERQEIISLFRTHGDAILEIGLNYPPFEVEFEQAIVAPAANILLQVYFLTREEKYLVEGKRQISVLELFNGHQPDYHRHEVGIRHWDGFWFGKEKLFADTFPQYWSGLTGVCFALYYAATGDKRFAKRAQDSLRGVLPMIFPDGSASCAYDFPLMVNGVKANAWDPYANDQDWALYFYLRMERDLNEILQM